MASSSYSMEGPRLDIEIASFRAFRTRSRLKVRPLTILYGENQSGKSTLLRTIPLLADSLAAGGGPLDLESPALLGASFKELSFKFQAAGPELAICIPDGGRDRSQLRLNFDYEDGLVVNQVQLLQQGDLKLTARFEDRRSAVPTPSFAFAGTQLGRDWNGVLSFPTLLPTGELDAKTSSVLTDVASALRPLERAQWLAAGRTTPREGENMRRCRFCRPDGQDLPQIIEGNPSLQQKVSAWLRAQESLGVGLELGRAVDGRPRFELSAPSTERMPLHLAGEGLRALLPTLICTQWLGEEDGPTILAIEEPEAHLHPQLQLALFDLFLQASKKGPIVLETHSVYFLRALQRAVLLGMLSPEDIALHWISREPNGEATARHVPVGPDGSLSGWLPDRFEQEQHLAREILDLRWRKRATRSAT